MHLRLRRHAWLALLAMLGLVCAPAISRALAAGQAQAQAGGWPAWMQICRHGSVVEASVVAPEPGGQPGAALPVLDACGLCGLAAQLSPPPASLAAPPSQAHAGADLAAPAAAPPRWLAWSPGRPRGPPAVA